MSIDWQTVGVQRSVWKQQTVEHMKISFKQMPFCNLYRNNAYSNIEEQTRENILLDVFLTNYDQLTRQIIITETSMSDHNKIQIETNIKFAEVIQNNQIKKSNLSYRYLNFFIEDISWASIDADLFNTSWNTLLTL